MHNLLIGFASFAMVIIPVALAVLFGEEPRDES
jgi:hypothetical protein